MFHSFFNSLAMSRYLSFFSHFSVLICGQPGQQNLQILSFLLLIIIRSGLLAEISWSVCMSKSHRSLRVAFSRTGLCIYHLCCISTFDPAKNAIPRWCTGRKWHILMAVMRRNRVGGNWLMKWEEVKKFPWYSHRLMHRKRVTCELHDSYFRWMTINHAIPKIE